MTKKLPWVTLPNSSTSDREIGNKNYGVLSIPYYGSLTPNEEIEIANYFVNLKDQSLSELKVYAATLLLQSRFDKEWTIADTYEEIKSFALIEDLYNFFLSERNRWQANDYLLKIEGKSGSLDIAQTYAEKVEGLVASKNDLADTYFVFQKVEDCPANFTIVVNYGSTVIEDSGKKNSLAEVK